MKLNFIPPSSPRFFSQFIGIIIVLVLLLGYGFYYTGSKLLNVSISIKDNLIPFSLNLLRFETPTETPVGETIALPPPPALPKLAGELPAETSFTAASIVVKDFESKAILYTKAPQEVRSLASITKLMSGLVLLEQSLDFTATTTVVTDDIVDTHMYQGEVYNLQELWDAGFVASSNKAILTLVDATKLSREAFVARMNEKAMELGLKQVNFVEPTGLDERNVGTASDVLVLLDQALAQEKIRESLLKYEHKIWDENTLKSHEMWNTNWLLLNWVPNEFEILGGKTGYISAAGYNFTTRLKNKDGQVLDVAVLGATAHEARFSEARDVAEGVLGVYEWEEK